MVRRWIQRVGIVAWFATYTYLAVQSGWAVLPIFGLWVGLVIFFEEITTAVVVAGKFLEDVFDVIYLVSIEFSRSPAATKTDSTPDAVTQLPAPPARKQRAA